MRRLIFMTVPQESDPTAAPGAAEPVPAASGAQVAPSQAAIPGGASVGASAGAPVTPRQHQIRRTRIGGVWVAIGLFALVLLLLLIFILQNGKKVDISFFGAHGHLPLGVALLLAAVLGILLVALPGTARILQLRRTARRHRKMDAKAAAAPTGAAPADPAQNAVAQNGVAQNGGAPR
jgi:lipopolysaccharide assembly protein A